MNPADRTAPDAQAVELTGAVVIGCGLSGMAVARELSRQGVDAIVVHGPVPDADALRDTSGEPGVFPERAELVRHLLAYATGHRLDVRGESEARGISLASPAGQPPEPAPGNGKWAVRTGTELLVADYVVVTSCSRSDLRKLTRAMNAESAPEAATALRGIGVYLVGVGVSLLPTVGSLIRQAKAAGAAIADAAAPGAAGPGAAGPGAAGPGTAGPDGG